MTDGITRCGVQPPWALARQSSAHGPNLLLYLCPTPRVRLRASRPLLPSDPTLSASSFPSLAAATRTAQNLFTTKTHPDQRDVRLEDLPPCPRRLPRHRRRRGGQRLAQRVRKRLREHCGDQCRMPAGVSIPHAPRSRRLCSSHFPLHFTGIHFSTKHEHFSHSPGPYPPHRTCTDPCWCVETSTASARPPRAPLTIAAFNLAARARQPPTSQRTMASAAPSLLVSPFPSHFPSNFFKALPFLLPSVLSMFPTYSARFRLAPALESG